MGQVLPVREVVALARKHCIDVQDIGLDFAGFNLHKRIGAPSGLGLVYIRASTPARIEPNCGERDIRRTISAPACTGACRRWPPS